MIIAFIVSNGMEVRNRIGKTGVISFQSNYAFRFPSHNLFFSTPTGIVELCSITSFFHSWNTVPSHRYFIVLFSSDPYIILETIKKSILFILLDLLDRFLFGSSIRQLFFHCFLLFWQILMCIIFHLFLLIDSMKQ